MPPAHPLHANRPPRAPRASDRAKRVKPETVSIDRSSPPSNPDRLHEWIEQHLDVRIGKDALLDGHAAPFDYLVHTFFEGVFERTGSTWLRRDEPPAAAPDCVVWANRGGGKTFLGALATLLDMVFKPGVQVRILAGSLEQSTRMYEHLRGFFQRAPFDALVDGKVTARRIALRSGSCVRLLAASQASVRGTRVQKIRCDEVDLFDPDLWKAAQLTTRTGEKIAGPWGDSVRGAIEALSTMQNPYGLMWEIVTGERIVRGGGGATAVATSPRRALFRWGVVDTLEHCPDSRACEPCGLRAECAGRAKLRVPAEAGHLTIDDALALKSRVDEQTWKSEMLCARPRRTDSVYPEFDPERHVVRDQDPRLTARAPIAFFAGMDFGFRAETVVLLASLDAAGTLVIEREHAAPGLTTADHIAAIRDWIDRGWTRLIDPALGECHGLKWIAIDPAGRARNDQTARSNFELLRAAGHQVRARPMGVHEGVTLVRTRLAPALGAAPTAERPGDAPTRLLIHERCPRLIECLLRYRYPEGNPITLEPCKKDGFDHACDALRYLVGALDRPATARVEEY